MVRARRVTLLTVVLAAVASGSPREAKAWGFAGHRIVCEIAWNELTARVKSNVRELLATDPDHPQFNETCLWPDLVRDDPRYADDKPRHYLDVHIERGAHGDIDLARDCREHCVTEGIEHYARALIAGGEPNRGSLRALAFLSHFVGDIHQPLHVGFDRDGGGNRIDIRPAVASKRSISLHEYWDTTLVEQIPGSWRDVAARLGARIGDEERAMAGTQLDPLAWARETHRIATEIAYELPEDGVVTNAYGDARRRVVEDQLTRAGVRLGALINQLLESDATAQLFMTGLAAREHNPLMGDDAPTPGPKPGP